VPNPSPAWWFDAHLDLAYVAVRGRDLTQPLSALTPTNEGPDPPAAVTLPALADGSVRFALGTIFTEVLPGDHAGAPGPEQYREGDTDGAYRRGRAQLEVYLSLAERGHLHLDLAGAFRTAPGVGQVRGGMGVSEVVPPPPDAAAARLARTSGLHIGILMENADPIRGPEDVAWWAERGVCAVGLAWARPSRYAMGNASDPVLRTGLTPAGLELVAAIDRCGLLHDASHLSDRALDQLFDMTPGRIIASHSNCRALLAPRGDPRNWQRHLTDRAIREIARRGGVIGLNLYSSFLTLGGASDRRATVDEALAHIERICELTGSHEHVGLGSDMDGGFSSHRLPQGIDRPLDLRRLSEGLTRRGWTREQVDGFAWRNWCRVFQCAKT